MRLLAGLFLAAVSVASSPALAQVAPLSFDAGKSLAQSPGQWLYVPGTTGSESRFGNLLAIRCDRIARVVVVELMGGAPSVLTVATSSISRTLPAGGRIAANDRLLDAIAFSRGRFLVAGGAGPVLAIPSWPEAARSIEDCRN